MQGETQAPYNTSQQPQYQQQQAPMQPQFAQPPMMQPQALPPQPIIVQPQLMNVAPLRLGKRPACVTCPNCRQNVQTVVYSEKGASFWLSFIGLWFIGCCCIPCFIDDFDDDIHNYPRCNYKIGERKMLF